jgi:nodulation protein E
MNDRRVAVTGIGAICALGNDRHQLWRSLTAGVCGIRPLEELDSRNLRITTGAMIAGFEPRDWLDSKTVEQTDRFAQLAIVAAHEAVSDAGIVWSDELKRRSGVVTGSALGGQGAQESGYRDLYGGGKTRVHPLTIPRAMANAGASQIAQTLGLTGAAFTISTACASSNHALGHAFWLVRHGVLELALAGGSEAPFTYGTLKAWEAMRVVSPRPCRPFCRDRDGMSLGEGGAMLVLEPLSAALERGARPYAELCGFGMSSDAFHLTQPAVEGPVRAMQSALADGALAPGDIDYINAHGTATPSNDAMETRAIQQVFGARAAHLTVSSTKSMHGHTLGAAGALEAAATVQALRYQIVPPTVSFTLPDPDCALDVVPNQARAVTLRAALSSSFAFGGLNAVLAFRRLEDAVEGTSR